MTEFKYKPTNREKSIFAKLGKTWCISCDSALVGAVGKCPVCGKRLNRKKRKQSHARQPQN